MLDTLLRGVAVGLSLAAVAALLTMRETRRKAAAPAALALTTVAYLVVSGPLAAGLPQEARIGLGLVSILTPLALTWFTFELFLDSPPGRRLWLLLAALVAPLAALSPLHPGIAFLRGGLTLCLYLGLAALALRAAPGDLVDRRRRARPAFAGAMATLGIVTTLAELSGVDASAPAWVFLAQALAFVALNLAFAMWALNADADLFAEERAAPARSDPVSPEAATAEARLAERAAEAMRAGAWRREGLTIGALAAELGAPEHRLRAAINRRLGSRNFPAFVNGYRIEAAKAALRDPDRAGDSVLEIAFESGFASLGPFNRAFREATGESPRDWRRAALKADAPKPKTSR